MIVVGTTVLVYAVGVEHPLREPCRTIVEAVGTGRVSATTTVEVIQEFAHVRARRDARREAAERAADYAVLFAPLLRPGDADVRRGLELYAQHPTLGAFDAVLAATVLNAPQLSTVVTADAGFSTVPGLTCVDPGAPNLWEVLGSQQA